VAGPLSGSRRPAPRAPADNAAPRGPSRVATCEAPAPDDDQLAVLAAYAEQPVPVDFEDVNGHLNVRHYTGIGSEGLDESLVDLGIPQNWPVHGHACFSAEHHLTYLAELRTGEDVDPGAAARPFGARLARPGLPARRVTAAVELRHGIGLPPHRHGDPPYRPVAGGRRSRSRRAGGHRRRVALGAGRLGVHGSALNSERSGDRRAQRRTPQAGR
jgi:hypothetical protein